MGRLIERASARARLYSRPEMVTGGDVLAEQERRPGSPRLFVAVAGVVYSYLTLVVVFVAATGIATDFVEVPYPLYRLLRGTRDALLAPMSVALAPLESVPGGIGVLFGVFFPVVANALVFLRSLRILRRRWLQGLAWRWANGCLLVLSVICLGASLVLAGLFLLFALAFGLAYLPGWLAR